MRRGILAGILLLVTGCQTGGLLPGPTLVMSPEAEALAGRRAAPALEGSFGGLLADQAAVDRMSRIGRRLAGGCPDVADEWHFHILASDRINAFSLPGGLIYITRGLYERIGSDDQLLAAIIAHEMAHVVYKDSLKPRCCTVAEALEREVRADCGAACYLAAAGYHRQCLLDLLRLIEDVQPAGWAEVRRNRLVSQT